MEKIEKFCNKLKALLPGYRPNPLRKGSKQDFIFIHINKTGGTSVSKVLGLPKLSHLTVRQVLEIVDEEAFRQAFVFSVVRNPWSKVLSHYRYRKQTDQTSLARKPISFNDWVARTYGSPKDEFYYDNPQMFLPQSEWLVDVSGDIPDNLVVLRFESLQSDFEEVREAIGVQEPLPHLKATSGDHYSALYTAESIEIVGEWFKEDIERWGYSF